MEALTFGRFRDLVPLGEGGMGRVFLARAVGPGGFTKPVVLKRMHERLAQVPSLVERFLTEARLQANLVCPSIVQVLDFGRIDETYFLVLEHVHGVDLGVLLAAGGPLPIGVAARIATDVCRGLGHTHRARGPSGEPLGLVHRDVSPQNILISYEGDVKLGDFGLARTTSAPDLSPGAIYGKPAYLAPEQARGERGDARSDLFALGTVLYAALTGVQPLRGGDRAETLRRVTDAQVEPVERLRPDVPQDLATLVRRAMQREPGDRFADAGEMLTALESACLALGQAATLTAVRALMQTRYPGAAERDPWAGQARPVQLELSRLVAEDGLTVLTAPVVPQAPLRPAPPWRRGLTILGGLLAVLVVLVVVAIEAGPSGAARQRPAPARPPPAAPQGEHPRVDVKAGVDAPATSADAPSPAPRAAPAQRREPPARPRTAAPVPAEGHATGRLRVGTSPGWGWVYVDGRRAGTTPLEIETAAGLRQVKVVSDTGHERAQTVRVEPGATGSLFLEPFE